MQSHQSASGGLAKHNPPFSDDKEAGCARPPGG
jgi:hypothetical protein